MQVIKHTHVCHPACHGGTKGQTPSPTCSFDGSQWPRYCPKCQDLGMGQRAGDQNQDSSASLLLWDRVLFGSMSRYEGAGVSGCCLGSKRVEESSLPRCKMRLFNTSSFPTGTSNQMLLQLATSRSSFMFMASDLLD